MATNLMQLRRLVRSRLGVPLDDDFMPDNVLDDHINLALQTIDAEAHWPWTDVMETVTVTPDKPDVEPAANWRSTRGLYYQDIELRLAAPGDIMRMNDLHSDVPIIWSPMQDRIMVRPIVNGDAQLVHYYYAQPTWLYDDKDSPSIPPEYTGAIVAKTAELLAARESSAADATRHNTEYKSWIDRMRRDMRRSTPTTTVRVRPGSWV